MNRRAVFTLTLGLLAAPLAAGAQQAAGKVPRIGFLQASQNENVVAFTQALRDAGYVDGHSVILETRIYGQLIELSAVRAGTSPACSSMLLNSAARRFNS